MAVAIARTALSAGGTPGAAAAIVPAARSGSDEFPPAVRRSATLRSPRVERVFRIDGDRASDQPLDVAEQAPLAHVAEREGDAARPRATGAADAMDVRIRLV